MLQDEKLAIDESERAARHQAIKGEVRREMQGEISRQARQDVEQHLAETAEVGEHFREKAISELAGVEAEIDRGRAAARVSQVVDYIFYLVYSLIGLEILLDLLGARETNAFKNFIDALSAPLLARFNTLMPDLARALPPEGLVSGCALRLSLASPGDQRIAQTLRSQKDGRLNYCTRLRICSICSLRPRLRRSAVPEASRTAYSPPGRDCTSAIRSRLTIVDR